MQVLTATCIGLLCFGLASAPKTLAAETARSVALAHCAGLSAAAFKTSHNLPLLDFFAESHRAFFLASLAQDPDAAIVSETSANEALARGAHWLASQQARAAFSQCGQLARYLGVALPAPPRG